MRNKGQGVIAEQLILAVSILTAILIFLVISQSGNAVQEQEISKSVELKLSDIRKRSVISNTLNDKLWRHPEISKGSYENLPAYKVISYYFSTPGNQMYFYDKQKSKSAVEEDLEMYLEFKMDRYWREGPNDTNYYLDIYNVQKYDRPQNITVQSYTPSGRQKRVEVPLSLANGTKARINLLTDRSQPINWDGGN